MSNEAELPTVPGSSPLSNSDQAKLIAGLERRLYEARSEVDLLKKLATEKWLTPLDERAEFEKWIETFTDWREVTEIRLEKKVNVKGEIEYKNTWTQQNWRAWQARAALHSASKPETTK